MENKVTLYIATHVNTGKKYFGKTICHFTEQDLQKHYHGSGSYWVNHKKKHGDLVSMKIYQICSLNEEDEDYVVPIAVKFSEENDIVKSKEWANQKIETGLDGGSKKSEDAKLNIGKGNKNKIISEEQKEALSEQASRKVCCLNCRTEVNYSNFKRYHQGDKCFDDKSFRKVSCVKCKREIGINNARQHTLKCFDGISLSSTNKVKECHCCNKIFNVKGFPLHFKSCSITKIEVIKIKKSSCCLSCRKEITNANIKRHINSCPKQDNKLLVFISSTTSA